MVCFDSFSSLFANAEKWESVRLFVSVLRSRPPPTIGEVLDMQDIPSAAEGGSMIFMRKCYAAMEEMIVCHIAEKQLRHLPSKILITGTPGTGKSTLMKLLLQKFLQEGQRVLYQTEGLYYVVDSSGVVFAVADAGVRLAVLSESGSGCVYLCDRAVPVPDYDGVTIYARSPLHGQKKAQFEKLLSLILYMPLWTESELLQCNRLAYHKDENEVLRLFDMMGGTARSVLEKSEREATRDLNKVLDDSRSSNLKAVVGPSSAKSSPEVYDRLVHMSPTEDMTDYVLVFASGYVSDALVERYWDELLDGDLGWLVETSSHPDLAVLRGHLFEGFFHRLMEKGTGRVPIKNLTEEGAGRPKRVMAQGTGESSMKSGDVLVEFKATRVHFFRVLSTIGELEAGVYCRPIARNFESMDAFMLSSDGDGQPTLNLFSVTIADRHTSCARGLEAVMRKVSAEETMPPSEKAPQGARSRMLNAVHSRAAMAACLARAGAIAKTRPSSNS